jgi:arsenic resistance protein ArsH
MPSSSSSSYRIMTTLADGTHVNDDNNGDRIVTSNTLMDDSEHAKEAIPYTLPTDDSEISRIYKQYRIHQYRDHKNEERDDWVSGLDLSRAASLKSLHENDGRIKILILYGSLRRTSHNKKLAYEFARILDTHFYTDTRIYDSQGLPIKDDVNDNHEKVLELRALSLWSDAQIYVSPEQHGSIAGVMKNLIDWIPLEMFVPYDTFCSRHGSFLRHFLIHTTMPF